MLTYVAQHKTTECGAACVAMLCGIGIAEARGLLGQRRSDETGWTSTSQIRTAISLRGLRLGNEVWTDDWTRLKSKDAPLLVAVNYKEWKTKTGLAKVSWHWAVYDPSDPEKPLLDPLSKKERRAPRTTRLCSYFHVYRTQ